MSWTGLTSFTLKFWINQNLNPIAWILLNEEIETGCFIFQPVLRNVKLGMMLDPMCGHHFEIMIDHNYTYVNTG